MKKFWDTIKDYVYIVIVVVLIRTFLVTPALVDGKSMYDNLDNNDLVIINKLIYRIKDIKRFDIVVVKNDIDHDKIIKRVIGLPGDKIQYKIEETEGIKKGILYINGNAVKEEFISDEIKLGTCVIDDIDICSKEVTLSNNEYYVMGDNRPVSKDSRYLGTFTRDKIIGKVSIRLFPFNKIGKVK